MLLTLRGTIDELIAMTEQLEAVEGVSGLVIDLAEPGVADALPMAVAEIRAATPLPLLSMLPHSPTIVDAARNCVAAGADALVACAYPPAVAATEAGLVDGVLLGPALLPWTLHALAHIGAAVEAPLIALGGVADVATARLLLGAGAKAVMVDSALHGDPLNAQRIAAALSATASAP